MPIDLYVLEHLFRHRVLRLLLRERRIDEAVIRKLLGWRHSGFSLHNAVRIGAGDTEGRSGVAEYILRSPFSLENVRYQARTGTIIYQSKMHPVLKQNFEVYSATDWLLPDRRTRSAPSPARACAPRHPGEPNSPLTSVSRAFDTPGQRLGPSPGVRNGGAGGLGGAPAP